MRKQVLLCIFLFWFLFPYAVQLVLSNTPVIQDVYVSIPAFVLLGRFDINFSLAMFLLVLSIPAIISAYIYLWAVRFRMHVLVISSVLGCAGLALLAYVLVQPCEGLGCLGPAFLGMYTGYYWSVLLPLYILAWVLTIPAASGRAIFRRSIVPGLLITLCIGVLISAITYPQSMKSKSRRDDIAAKMSEYKSTFAYINPAYVPAGVGKKVVEEISSGSDLVSPRGTTTAGLRSVYQCKGSDFDQIFVLVEGPHDVQKLSLDDIYATLSESEMATEKIDLSGVPAVYKQSRMEGASTYLFAGIVFDYHDTRVEMIIDEACVANASAIKPELIRIVESMIKI